MCHGDCTLGGIIIYIYTTDEYSHLFQKWLNRFAYSLCYSLAVVRVILQQGAPEYRFTFLYRLKRLIVKIAVARVNFDFSLIPWSERLIFSG